MPERWQRELKKLRHAEPRADLWMRVEEGPHGSPTHIPARQRLVAGGVAFAVFIAAGVFAWNALRPAAENGLPPADSPQAILAFNELDPQAPQLSLTVGGATFPATLGTHSWTFDGGSGVADAVTPTFIDTDAVRVTRGTPLLVDNAPPTLSMTASEGLTPNHGPPLGTPLQLDLTTSGWHFDLPAGRYLVVVDAQWDDAQAEFWLPIEIVPPGATSPTPQATTELDRDGIVVTYPNDWDLASEILTPTLTDPREILAIGTYPLRPGGSSCAQYPMNAIEDLGPTDALIWLTERQEVSPDAPSRPSEFETWLSAAPVDESSDCLSVPKDFVHHYGEFTDAGRGFAVYVAYGASVAQQTLSELWGVLDGMHITPSGR